MTLTPLTPPPTAPSRSDPPEMFITRADEYINWWSGTFAPEFNALLPEIVLAGSANNYGATSTTSLAIGTGSKTLTVQAGKAFQIGQFVQIANTATPANYMFGQVTAYNSSTGSLTVLVSSVGGSGTFTAWTVGLAATGGAYAQLAGATFTGAVITDPSTSGGAGFNIPHGAAPSSPVNGDMWTTSGALFARIGGTTRQFMPTSGGTFTDNVTIAGVSGNNYLQMSALAGQGGYTRYSRSSIARWETGIDSSTESGSNTGGNWVLRRFDDAGTSMGFILTGNRATGAMSFTYTPDVAGDSIVTRTSTDTLTNKTLTSPTINSAALNPIGSAPLCPARARVSFSGTGTVTITDSANVSSITDNALGDYTMNLITAMPNANYQWSGNAKAKSAGYVYSVYRPSTTGTKTTTALQISVGAVNNTGAAADDSDEVCIVIYG